jgi:hypothetical protein
VNAEVEARRKRGTMSITKRVTKNKHGDVVLTVTLVGWNDAARFAYGMQTLQCEFGDQGRRAMWSIRQQVGADRHDKACKQLGIPNTR